jgi:hypothetical protein
MSVEFKIELLPEYMLGRYFQLAALAPYLHVLSARDPDLFSMTVKNLVQTNNVELTYKDLRDFATNYLYTLALKYNAGISQDLDNTLCNIYNKIVGLNTQGRKSKKSKKSKSSKRKIGLQPKTYRDNDSRPLSDLGFNSFNPTRCLESKTRSRKSGSSSTQLDYAVIVLSLIKDIMTQNLTVKDGSKAPFLMRAFYYSTLRGKVIDKTSRSKRKKQKEEEELYNNLSVAFGMAGALLSFINYIKLAERAGGRIEHYIVPDGTIESLQHSAVFYNLVFSQGLYRLRSTLRAFYEVPGISLEKAYRLSIARNLIDLEEEDLDKLIKYNVSEKLLFIEVHADMRPDVYSVSPLAVTKYINVPVKREILNTLFILARSSSRSQKLASAVSTCINTLSEYYYTDVLDLLVECSRDVLPLLFSRDIGSETRNWLLRLLKQVREVAYVK